MKAKDLTGCRFNKMWVVGFAGKTRALSGRSHRMWDCLCDCGSTARVAAGSLLSGDTKSCGCLVGGVVKHGSARHGQRSPEYKIWCGMRTRCTNPDEDAWEYYGARGIKVCQRWESFESFLADMGPRPSRSHSIDRIDVNGDYEPSNCRWATAAQQAGNRRPRRTAPRKRDPESGQLLAEIAAEAGLKPSAVLRRFRLGYRGKDLVEDRRAAKRFKRKIDGTVVDRETGEAL